MSILKKSPSESQIQMREMVMPGDTNKHGTIFGGKIMSWIDIAAAMCAERHCQAPVVTAHIDDIDFLSPIKVGHHVIIKASINFSGTSSMIIGVRVESENPYTGQRRITTKAYLTFVALDEFGKPLSVPKVDPKTEDEIRRYENAKKRKQSNKDLRKELK
jgi:acyl-CoA hydrolase